MLLNAMKNTTYTEKGALTNKSTMKGMLDFFALAGAMRNRSESDIISLFDKAYSEDEVGAIVLAFYFRDCREGQGERRLFRVIMHHLAKQNKSIVISLLPLIMDYGRGDDFYCLVDTPVETEMFKHIKQQLAEDWNAEFPSLLAKWIKSENASSPKTKELAKKTRLALGMSPKQYRQGLSAIRAKLNLIETKMTQGNWSEIEYDKIPSKAGMQYRSAFYRHDEERYVDFIKPKVVDGQKQEVVVNAKTLYPYEIVGKCLNTDYRGMSDVDQLTMDAYWNNLPDYLKGEDSNALAVVDVSGSMFGTPIEVAISLGMYVAEKNQGEFHNHFMTFSTTPELVEIKGENVYEKVSNMSVAHWSMSTNIEGVFKKILSTAVRNSMTQKDMPSIVYIISDMEFDNCMSDAHMQETVFQNLGRQYAEAGFELPHLVFWNVDARQNNIPMIGEGNYSLVSGFSPAIFDSVMKRVTAEEVMMDVINKERYKPVIEALA